MNRTLEYFEQLGRRIEARFKREGYREDSLVEIAREELLASPAHANAEPLDILQHVSSGGRLPAQLSSDLSFGQPPVTIFSAPRFVIDIYYWFDGTTSIHEHGFCGAFQVFGGSSLHAVRRFRCDHEVNSRFLLGQIETDLCETLRVGDTRPIHAGDKFAHSLFHLDKPSTTVVVRTRSNPRSAPQYTYVAPHVAFDPFHKPYSRTLQLSALNALYDTGRAAHVEAVEKILENSTLEDAYYILLQESGRQVDEKFMQTEAFLRGSAAVAKLHGDDAVQKLIACFEHSQRHLDLAEGRAFTSDPDQRFLLATLLNAHSRAQVLEFTRSRYADREPVDAFMDLFAKMAEQTADGGQNALGFELGTEAVLLVRFLLEGVAVEGLPERLIASGFTRERVEAQVGQIREFYKTLGATAALRVLTI